MLDLHGCFCPGVGAMDRHGSHRSTAALGSRGWGVFVLIAFVGEFIWRFWHGEFIGLSRRSLSCLPGRAIIWVISNFIRAQTPEISFLEFGLVSRGGELGSFSSDHRGNYGLSFLVGDQIAGCLDDLLRLGQDFGQPRPYRAVAVALPTPWATPELKGSSRSSA